MMDFFLYSPKLVELGSVKSIAAWLREEFDQHGYSAPSIEEREGGWHGTYIHIEVPGLFRSGLHLESGREPRYQNTAYCVKYLGLPDEILDKIRDAELRLNISAGTEDPNHPEDCVDFVGVFSEIEGGCFFGPREFHVRKMENAEKNVTKNWVSKRILPAVSDNLENQGFVPDGLSFGHRDGRNLEFDFMTKANYEFSLCTRGSFQVVAFKKWTRKIVPTRDNCLIRYVEPDGSNIDDQITELGDLVAQVDDDWWTD